MELGKISGNDVRSQVYDVLHKMFPSYDRIIDDEMGPEEVPEWDSYKHLELIMMLGEEFSITLGFEEVLEISTVGDIFVVLRNRGIE